MVNYNDQIKQYEDELKKTPYNKRTQGSIGLLKAKIARLKDREEKRSSKGKKGEGYSVKKTGDATVVLLGYPSVGKSSLLNVLTNADSPVGAYAFTTLKVIPGLLEHRGAKIQILDVPGVVRGAAAGTGRGKEVLSVLRNASLILILIDANHPEHYQVLLKEIRDFHIRINGEKPDVKIKKVAKGGIQIGKTVKLPKLTNETISSIMREFRINNGHILIRSVINDEDLIDAIEGNKVYIPAITVVNKMDMLEEDKLKEVCKSVKADLAVSAEMKLFIEELKELIFKKLNLIRLYLKEPGKPADLKEPLIIFKDCTIEDVCNKLHREFVTRFRFARVWGKSVKFDGQKVLKIKHMLQDEDILELHID